MTAPLFHPRYERKFLPPGCPLAEVLAVVRRHPAGFREIYRTRTVNNLYLDTPGLSDYFDHIHGVAIRLKTRLRWYGPLNGHIDQPVLERKFKRGSLSGKTVSPLPPLALNGAGIQPALANALNEPGVPENLRASVRQLVPALLNRYQRRYFQSTDRRFRLTVDWDLQFAAVRSNAGLDRGWSHRDPAVIVELKYAPEAAERAADVTNALPWRLARCSKYVTGLKRLSGRAETGLPLPSPHLARTGQQP